ncbi:hypothetical protein QN239_08995 [Mycolicibacterium sp. Y3]
MSTAVETSRPTDPSTLTPAQWNGRSAALSRDAPPDDPRVAECRAALAYWRIRRAIDADRDNLDPAHVPALADLLRHAHPAGSR